MPTPEHPDEYALAAFAMGDALDAASRDHVAGCTECSGEVAAFRATITLVGEAREETFAAPPAHVWDAVQAELRGSTTPPAPAGVVALAQRRRQVPAWWVGVAASLALVVGLGVGTRVGDEPSAPPIAAPTVPAEVVGSTELASLDETAHRRGSAEVRRHDDRVTLHVAATDLGGPQGTREVWLINLDGTRMVSLGMLPTGESGDFEFPERLLDQGYRIVDVSFEPDDGDPTHSGESLARGTIES